MFDPHPACLYFLQSLANNKCDEKPLPLIYYTPPPRLEYWEICGSGPFFDRRRDQSRLPFGVVLRSPGSSDAFTHSTLSSSKPSKDTKRVPKKTPWAYLEGLEHPCLNPPHGGFH